MNVAAGPVDFDSRRMAARLPSLPRAAWVEVNLAALVTNTQVLQRIAGSRARVAAVVKADGYGHGIELSARAAVAGGATFISVATLDEALVIRHNCPAVFGDAPATGVVVNYPVPRNGLADAAAARIDVVAGSDLDVEGLTALGGAAPRVHLEIDTGMTRGGMPPARAPGAAARLAAAGVRIAGTWSHLAAPDDPDRTRAAVRLFEGAIAAIRAEGIDPGMRHICASGGLLAGAPAYELVRPGLALYGLHPGNLLNEHPDSRLLRPALSVRAFASRLADVPAGIGVGYSATWVTARPSRIATLPIGYADGWLRGAGPETRVLVRGVAVPVVGRVSSDSMALDVTDVPGVTETDEYMLLGSQDGGSIPAEAVAAARGTITWEVLQTLSRRLPRVYQIDGEIVAVRRLDRPGVDAVADLEARLREAARRAGPAGLPRTSGTGGR